MDMKQESENDFGGQKPMEGVEPEEEQKQEDVKGMEKDPKGQSAEPDIQAFM